MADAAPRRGRPPTHSRARIVEAVTDALLAEPEAPMTIAWMSEVTGIAPMSLYRHFADRDDIVRAVAAHLFVDSRPPTTPGSTWQEEVRAWMRHVHDQSIRVPQLVRQIAGGGTRSWLAVS